VCGVLQYKDIKKAFQLYEYKVYIKDTEKEVDAKTPSTILGSEHFNNLTYNEGKDVYLKEPGLYQLIMPIAKSFQKYFFLFPYSSSMERDDVVV